MIRISKVSKLDGIKSWSLPARETCPGAKVNGELCPVCKGCYASTGNYRFPNVKAPREENKQDWKREGWADDMVKALAKAEYFRWLDSGDVYCRELAEKIKEVIERTPHVKHWLPTKSYRVASIRPVLDEIRELPNACVRYSALDVDGSYESGLHGSTVVPTHDTEVPDVVHICSAYERGGKCAGCRACWDKDVEVVAYVAHGRSMAKVVREQNQEKCA
ncbi:GP88 family protein [Desulfovibrio oxyclinae]|uniref:GP88 family protein n=1 Tax=Desulfovibrio oxyclinae TaxID=63560 RepID=UPI00036DEDF6|nr:hypothetical protein [Desulfovibrio oxyclinae]